MGKSNTPSSLTEAIERLENASQSKAQDFKEILEGDYEQIKKALEDLRPHLDNLKKTAHSEIDKRKNEVEEKVKDNPWMVIGIVGLFAFIIGLFLGSKKD